MTRERVLSGEEYLGFARQKLSILEAQRVDAGLPSLRRDLEIDGVTIIIVADEYGGSIYIEGGGVAGFLLHPRSDAFPNGLDPEGVALSEGPVDYPLIDGDRGTRNLNFQDEEWQYEADPPENYGNLDWIGSNTAAAGEPSDAPILTWRGQPGRQIPLSTSQQISGLTEFYYSSTFLEDHYTALSNRIYQGGEVIAVAPGLVRGAAYNGEWLVAVVSAKSGTYFDRVAICSSGCTDPQNWEVLAEFVGSSANIPCFFNPAGTIAICGTSKIIVNPASRSASSEAVSTGLGTSSRSASPYSVQKEGEWRQFFDFSSDGTEQSLTITMEGDDHTTHTEGRTPQVSDLAVYQPGVADVPAVSGPDAIYDGAQYTATGGVPPYKWKTSYGSIDNDGVVTIPDAPLCPDQMWVSATDTCGTEGIKGGIAIAPQPSDPLTISGPDAPVDGNTYTASGGVEPYSYSISKGSIDAATGVVTVSGQCGPGQVVVTDFCGNSAGKTIRLPVGTWVAVDWACAATQNTNCSCGSDNCTCYIVASETSCTSYMSPTVRVLILSGAAIDDANKQYCNTCCDGEGAHQPPSNCLPATWYNPDFPNRIYNYYVRAWRQEEWVCP